MAARDATRQQLRVATWSTPQATGMNFLKNLTSSLLDEQEKFTDLIQVSVVDADACLDVLAKRFEHGSIYTHCGPLLVAVNPYTDVEGLYTEEVLEQHLQRAPRHRAGFSM